jgi:hypothetical protein
MELPLGFLMALSRDIEALRYFADMDEDRQKMVIEAARHAESKAEMDGIVHRLRPETDMPAYLNLPRSPKEL